MRWIWRSINFRSFLSIMTMHGRPSCFLCCFGPSSTRMSLSFHNFGMAALFRCELGTAVPVSCNNSISVGYFSLRNFHMDVFFTRISIITRKTFQIPHESRDMRVWCIPFDIFVSDNQQILPRIFGKISCLTLLVRLTQHALVQCANDKDWHAFCYALMGTVIVFVS